MRRIPQEFNRVVTNSRSLSNDRTYRANDVWKAIKDIELLKKQPYVKDLGFVQQNLDHALSMYYKATKSISDGSIRDYTQEKSAFDVAASSMEKALDGYLDKAQQQEVGIKVEPSWHEDHKDRDLKQIVCKTPHDAPDPRSESGRYRGGEATPAERPAENGYGWELWMTFDDDPSTIYIIGREREPFNTYEDAESFIQRYYPSFEIQLDKNAFADRLFNDASPNPQLEGRNPRATYRSVSMKAIAASPPSGQIFYPKNLVVNYDKKLDGLLEELRRGSIRLSVMLRKPAKGRAGVEVVRKELKKWTDNYIEVNDYYPKLTPTIKRFTVQIRKLTNSSEEWIDGPWNPLKYFTEKAASEWSDFWLGNVKLIQKAQSYIDENKAEKAKMAKMMKNVSQIISSPAASQYPSPSEAVYTTKLENDTSKAYKVVQSAIAESLKTATIELFKLATSDHVIYDYTPISESLNKVIALKELMLSDSSYFSSSSDVTRFKKQIAVAKNLEADMQSDYDEMGYVSDDLHRMLEVFSEDEVYQVRKILQSTTVKIFLITPIADFFRERVGTIVGALRVVGKIFADVFNQFTKIAYNHRPVFSTHIIPWLEKLASGLAEQLKNLRKSYSQFRESKKLENITEKISLSERRTRAALSYLKKIDKEKIISSDVFKRVTSLLLPDFTNDDDLKEAFEEAAAGEVAKEGGVPEAEAEKFVQTGDIPDSVLQDITRAFGKAGVQIEGDRIRDIDMLFHDMTIPNEDEIRELYEEWNSFERYEVPTLPKEDRPTINEGVIDALFEKKMHNIKQNIINVMTSDRTYALMLKFIELHPTSDIAGKFKRLVEEAKDRHGSSMDAEPALEALISKNRGNTNVQYFEEMLKEIRSGDNKDDPLKRGREIYDEMMKFITQARTARDNQSNEFKQIFANVVNGKPFDSGDERARRFADQFELFMKAGKEASKEIEMQITDEVIHYLAKNFLSNLTEDDWKYLVVWVEDHNLIDFSKLQ